MREFEYSDESADIIRRFLDDNKWNYSFNEKTGMFHFWLKIRGKIQKINYIIDVHKDEIITYGISPIMADPDDLEVMKQVAEFVCRANYGLKNGCFEFDFSDGEVRFRSFVDCDNQRLSVEVIKNSVLCTAAMYKRYTQGFTDIIFGRASARDAIKKCEKATDDELDESERKGEEPEEPHIKMNLFGTEGGETQ